MFLEYLKALNKELIILFSAIVLTATILMLSKQYWDETVLENQQAEQRLQQGKSNYRRAIDRTAVLKEYQPRYEALKNINVVGDENRIDWINLIEIIVEDEKIAYLKYSIDKQIKYKDKVTAMKYPGLNIYKSVMTIEMYLLHEGDLYAVINGLKAKAKGLFDVSSCEIKRNKTIKKSIVDNTQPTNFTTVCKLNWYTFKPKSA